MVLCGLCFRSIPRKAKNIQCSACMMVFHVSLPCSSMKEKEYERLNSEQKLKLWKCINCIQTRSKQKPVPRIEVKNCSGSPSEKSFDSDDGVSLDVLRGLIEKKFDEQTRQLADYKLAVDFICAQFDDVIKTVTTIQEENSKRDEKVKTMEEKLSQIEEGTTGTMQYLENKVAVLEQKMRQNNIEVTGIPSTTGENIPGLLDALAQILGLDFQFTDIEKAHRVSSFDPSKEKPIIVTFLSYQKKLQWIYAVNDNLKYISARQLSNNFPHQRIYINHHLSPYFKTLFMSTKHFAKKHNYEYCWWDGKNVVLRKRKEKAIKVTYDLLNEMEASS